MLDLYVRLKMFPSLSGKTSIRTWTSDEDLFVRIDVFPSLSGKTSIRTTDQPVKGKREIVKVSIPFREDLYSD